jgi:hypothetical protein
VHIPQISGEGDNWWRPRASCIGGIGMGLSLLGFSSIVNAAVLGQTVYVNCSLFISM